MNLQEIRSVLATRRLQPLRQLGQNFLHDQNLARFLAASAREGLAPGARIVEIGPGLGALTAPLLEAGLSVCALEKDRGLAAFLRERFSAELARGQLELRESDALTALPQLGFSPDLICGNLPYYISTPLLWECLNLPGATPRCVFVVQREVAQRLSSRPGSKDYGGLSVLVQARHQVRIFRYLPGSVFFPAPEVHSAAIEIKLRPVPLVELSAFPRFTKVVHQGFSQRRKKLSNLLPVADGRRAEHLSLEEWVTLWHEVESARTALSSQDPAGV